MKRLGEVQYNTGIPKYFYDVRNIPQQAMSGLGQYDIFAPTGTKGTGASGFQQATGAVGAIGNIATNIINSFNQTSIEKKRLKYEKQIQELQLKLGAMTEKERIAANIEIERIRSEMQIIIEQEGSRFGIGMTKILALAAVGSIGLVGLFAVLPKLKG